MEISIFDFCPEKFPKKNRSQILRMDFRHETLIFFVQIFSWKGMDILHRKITPALSLFQLVTFFRGRLHFKTNVFTGVT